MIKTSEVNIAINKRQILSDFQIVSVTIEDKKNRTYEFTDLLSEQLNGVLGTLYRYGNKVYLIFKRRNFDFDRLVNNIEMIFKDKKLNVIVNKIEMNNDISKEDICQLFCNMIPYYDNGDSNFNNVSGKLYYFNDQSFKKDVITAYKITIEKLDKEGTKYGLFNRVESYYRIALLSKYHHSKSDMNKINNLPRYYYDKDIHMFKRANKEVKQEDCFIKMSVSTKKNKFIAKDLDIQDHDTFLNSKKGIIFQFLKDFNDYFSKYIRIDLVEIFEEDIIKSYNNVLNFKIKTEIFNKYAINLLNLVKDEESGKIIEEIQRKLNSKDITNITLDKDDAVFNLALIHDEDYYEKNNVRDLHTNDKIIQHITYEMIVSNESKQGDIIISDQVIKRVLDELLIKYDIYNNKLTLFDLNLKEKISFVIMENLPNNKYVFYQVIINPDKSLNFEIIDEVNHEKYKEFNDMFNVQFGKNYSKTIASPELLVLYKDSKTLIFNTGINVMPDFDELNFRLENYDKENLIPKEKLLNVLEDFKKESSEYTVRLENIIEKVKEDNKEKYQYQEVVNGLSTSKGIAPLISLKTKLGKNLVEYTRENYEIVLNPCLKSDVVDIFQSIHILSDVFDHYSVYYYVGSKYTMQFDLVNANSIRKITFLNGEVDEERNREMIEVIISMMSVDFVRNGEYTVLPFVNKYLKEFRKMRRE